MILQFFLSNSTCNSGTWEFWSFKSEAGDTDKILHQNEVVSTYIGSFICSVLCAIWSHW